MVLDMQAHTCFFLSFCLFGDVAFSEYFMYHPLPFSLRMESTITVVRFSLPDGVFLRCDHGLDFRHQLTT